MRRAAVVAMVLIAATACGTGQRSSIAEPNAVDIGFAQDMSVHHEQAVLMSQVALHNGTPAIRDLALAILSSQAQEIGAMRGWLRVWNQSPVDPTPMAWMGQHAKSMPSMAGMTMPSGMSMPAMSTSADPTSMNASVMPGMATPAQMLELTQAHGAAFDVLFATLMVTHHVAGIQMAQAAVQDNAGDLVTQAAQQMITSQYEDLGLLRTFLNANGVKS